MSVPEMWKRLFLQGIFVSENYKKNFGIFFTQSRASYHRTHDTYSPVGNKNLLMYCSGAQSTGAEMRKYFTVPNR